VQVTQQVGTAIVANAAKQQRTQISQQTFENGRPWAVPLWVGVGKQYTQFRKASDKRSPPGRLAETVFCVQQGSFTKFLPDFCYELFVRKAHLVGNPWPTGLTQREPAENKPDFGSPFTRNNLCHISRNSLVKQALWHRTASLCLKPGFESVA
jgi:hypothetical protein